MPSFILDMTEDANEDLSYYRAFERKMITDKMAVQLVDQPDVETNQPPALARQPDCALGAESAD
jgi:hypothetical protein